MGDRDDDGAVLYGVAQGCFVWLLVRVCWPACLPVHVFVMLTYECVPRWGWRQVQRRWAAGGRDEKVYKINTPDLTGLVAKCMTAAMLGCLFITVKKCTFFALD